MDNHQIMHKEMNNQGQASTEMKDAFFEYPDARPQISEEQLSGLPEDARKTLLDVCNRVAGLAAGTENFVRSAVEYILRSYFTCMVDFLKAAEEERYSFLIEPVDYSRAVEALYLLGCERDKRTNFYYIPKWHPVRIIEKLLDEDLERLLTKDGEKEPVLEAVFNDKNRNRRQITLFCRNQVYETSPEDSGALVKAYPFRQKEGNTRIPYLRIWEKLYSYQERHPELDTIRVAVFGHLTGNPDLVNELLGSETKVEWVFFEQFLLMGEHYFQDLSGWQLYDLSMPEDVGELMRNYNIILFLDQNCLYRQWQSEKTAEERNEASHCRWYLNRSRDQKAFKEKAAYYQSIYHHVGLWLNSLRQRNSSSFEFDSLLFRNLMEMSNKETDIYLYIKGSNRIASYNLEYSGVCNDEYYGGKSLLVYKLARIGRDSFNRDYRDFLVQSRRAAADKENSVVFVKFWKITKSISNEYCDRFLAEVSNETGISQSRLIRILDASYLVLRYGVNADEKKIQLGYDVTIAEQAADARQCLLKRMESLSEVILKYALETENMYCIRKYFKELLINSVITNAGNISDLVFAHIWSQSWMRTELRRIDMGATKTDDERRFGKHKLHKTIFVLIERLENLRMRSVPDMRKYFLDTLRNIVSPEVDEENFEETLHCIAECCEKFHHTGSSLFLNSTLIDKQEELSRG